MVSIVFPFVACSVLSRYIHRRKPRQIDLQENMSNIPPAKRNVVPAYRTNSQTAIDQFILGEGSAQAVKTLFDIMKDAKQAGGVRVTAAIAFLDRAGYTPKRHERKDVGTVEAHVANFAQLRQLVAELEAELVDITPKTIDAEPIDEPATSQALDPYE